MAFAGPQWDRVLTKEGLTHIMMAGCEQGDNSRRRKHRQLLKTNRDRFLVLDNASYHATPEVLDVLGEHAEHAFVVWLPTYSPELNAIEGLWGCLKRTATNNYFFGDTETLEAVLHEVFVKLNQHTETTLSLAYHTSKNLGKTA